MKYVLHHASPAIIWPGFHIETKTGDGAAKLAEELNRLDTELVRTRVELQTQIEAKNNALRKVTDLEALGVELELRLKGSVTNRALKQRLSVRTGQVRELLYVLEHAQGILAEYIEPNGRVKPRAALTSLLGVLDDSALVTMMRELISVKNNGACYQSEPFSVQDDQVYVNARLVDPVRFAIKPSECVVNSTTNHFAPSKKLKRRVKKLRARVSELENARDELLSEIRANAERD